MAKVVKASDPNIGRIVPVARLDLEEFPEAVVIGLAVEEEAVEEELVEEIDPMVLREEILAEARAEAAQKVQEAYTEGFQRGVAAGQEAFEISVGEAADALKAVAEEIAAARERFLDTLEPQVVDLAMAVAERVVQSETHVNPELIHKTVRRALALIADRQSLRVRVNPADLIALREHKITLLEDFEGVEELEMEASDEVGAGGCVVESERMQVDARLEVLLQNLVKELISAASVND